MGTKHDSFEEDWNATWDPKTSTIELKAKLEYDGEDMNTVYALLSVQLVSRVVASKIVGQ